MALFGFGAIGVGFVALLALVYHAAMIACVVIAVVSLVRIARSCGEMVEKCDDIKKELEELKRKE